MTVHAHPPPRVGDPPEDDDGAVVRRSLDDAEAFAALYDRHAAALHRYAVRRLGREAAEDVVAEAFLAAFRIRHR